MNKCSGRGKCNPVTNKCHCNNGFYGDDCSKSPYDLAYAPWISFRVITAVAYFSLMLFVIAVLIIRRRRSMDVESVTTLGFFNAHSLVLGFVFIVCLDVGLIFAIDPAGINGTFPYPVFRYMFGIVFPLMSTLYCIILFLWVDVYDTTIQVLKREEKLRKINKNYNKETTLTDILEQTGKLNNVLHRFKIVIVSLNVGAWIYQIVREALLSARVVTTRVPWVQQVWLAYFGVVYLVETIGFFYYAPKLLSIMPSGQISKKMLRVTRIIRVQAIIFMICWVALVCILSIPAVNVGLFVFAEFVYRFIVFVILCTIMSLFVRMERNWPFLVVRDSGRSKKSSSDYSSGGHIDSRKTDQSATNIELQPEQTV